MNQTVFNWIFGILIVGALTIALLAYFKPAAIFPPEPAGTPKKGFGDSIGQVLSQVSKTDWWKNLFACKGDYAKCNCNKDKSGYNNNGILDPSCGATTGACDPFACDPNKLGYNMCGDAGFPCTCGSESPQALC